MKQNKFKKNHYKFLELGTILLLLLSLYGCNPNSSPNVVAWETKQIITSPTRLVTRTDISKIWPTATATITPTYTLPPTINNSATPTPIQTILWTPAPTLSQYQSNVILHHLYQNTDDCKLPCWFGITPGVTSWWDARNFLQPISRMEDQGPFETVINGKIHHGISHYIYFDLSNEVRNGGFLVGDLDGITDFIYIGEETSTKGNITLPRLLTEHGRPDKVYVKSTINVPGYPYPFDLVLYYQGQNILAKFNLDGKIVGDKVCAYPQYKGPQLSVWSDNSQFELSDNEYPTWILGTEEKEPLPIEQATNLDIEKFYQTFRNSKYAGNICTSVD
jgi:hypothetical protein